MLGEIDGYRLSKRQPEVLTAAQAAILAVCVSDAFSESRFLML